MYLTNADTRLYIFGYIHVCIIFCIKNVSFRGCIIHCISLCITFVSKIAVYLTIYLRLYRSIYLLLYQICINGRENSKTHTGHCAACTGSMRRGHANRTSNASPRKTLPKHQGCAEFRITGKAAARWIGATCPRERWHGYRHRLSTIRQGVRGRGRAKAATAGSVGYEPDSVREVRQCAS